MQIDANTLQHVVDQILSVVDPASVVLFGSFARGDANDHSDLDLLVIREHDFLPGESRHKQIGAIYRAVSELPDIPKDILLLTRNEFLTWKNTTNHLAAVASREGRVIHGRI